MIISEKINETFKNIYHIEIIKNDKTITVTPFSGVCKRKGSEDTIVEVALPAFVFDLTQGPYTLPPELGKENGMIWMFDINTEIPRLLRGSKFGITQKWEEIFIDTDRYLTLNETIEFRDCSTNKRAPFNFCLKYDYEVNPNIIKIFLPLG